MPDAALEVVDWRQVAEAAVLMPAVFAPASSSRRIAMIRSSVNRFALRPSSSGGRTLLEFGGDPGLRSRFQKLADSAIRFGCAHYDVQEVRRQTDRQTRRQN
jgi:hypothetical protein